jgi:hypothetical protein
MKNIFKRPQANSKNKKPQCQKQDKHWTDKYLSASYTV